MPQTRKDWRKISTTDVEEAIDTTHVQREAEARDLANELFEIDTEGANKKAEKRERRGVISFAKKRHSLLESEEKKLEKYTQKLQSQKDQPRRAEKSLDLWGEEEKPKLWCGRKSKESGIRVCGKMEPYQKPRTLDHRPSVAPAVCMAHSGQSINPKQENYEALVSEAAAVELKKEEEQEYLFRASQGMTADLIDRHGKEAVMSMTQEEKVKLFLGEAPEEEPVELPDKRPTERKTTTQRNKEAKAKALKAAQAQSKRAKQLQKSCGDIGTVLKEMNKTQRSAEERAALKKQKRMHKLEMEKEGKLVDKAKIGKYRFAEPALEAQQPRNEDEGVKTSVRRANVLMGSAIRDRMHSILRRKMLPANPLATAEVLTKAKESRFHKRKLRKYCSTALREAVREGRVKKSRA